MKYIKYMFPFVAVVAILAGCGDSDVYEEPSKPDDVQDEKQDVEQEKEDVKEEQKDVDEEQKDVEQVEEDNV